MPVDIPSFLLPSSSFLLGRTQFCAGGRKLKYETYLKLIIATGMRQGGYCAICMGVTSTGRSTSRRFRQLFHAHTVVQSFSNSWRPHDNAVAEPFSATLKQEELYRKDYTSEADFKQCLASCIEYIELYNTQRPHRTLKNRIPCRVEEAFMNSKSGGAVC